MSATNDGLQNKQDENVILNKESQEFLMEGVKWSKFMAILGFIGLGMMVIAGLFIGLIFGVAGIFTDELPGFIGVILSVFYIGIAVVYFFPVLYLFHFSSKSKKALVQSDPTLLTDAFRYFKQHFKYLGIMTIVVIGMYIIGIFVAILVGLFSAISAF